MVTSNDAARLGGQTLGGHPSMPGAVMFAATSPRYARYVGRVGALAVALGVGVAVATGQGMGVARAETGTESGSPSDNPSAEPANNPPANADPTPPSPAPTTPPTKTNGTPAPGASPTNNPAAPKMKLGTDGTVDTSHNDTGQATNANDKGDVVPPTGVTAAPTTPPQSPPPSVPPVNPPVVNPPVVTENPPVVPENPAPQGNSAPAGTPNTPINPPPADPDTGDSEQTVIEHDSGQQMAARLALVPQDVQPSAGRASLMMATAAAAVVNTPAPAPLVPQPAGPIDVLLGIPGVVVNIATTVVATLLSAFLTPGPVAPAQPPVLFALLAWVQREIQRTFFNSTPDGVIDTVTTSEDIAKTFPVLGNDTDADTAAGDVITVTDYTQPVNGTVALNPDGTFTYTPDADFNGTDSFTYTISDAASPWHVHGLSGFFFGGGHTDTTTVTITVNPVNDDPVGVADAYTMDEDTVLTVNKPGVLSNDTDLDHPVINPALDLTAVKVVGSGPTNGTVAFYSDGSFIYTPNLNFNGTDQFTYVANDGLADSAPTTVTITVNAVNDPPVAGDDTATTNEDTPIDISVLGNDTDIDSPTLTVSSAISAHGGTVTINPNGTLHYTPAANFNGTDTLTYTVSDGPLTDTGTVTVTVTPASDVVDNITFPDGASPSDLFVAGTDPTKIYVLTGDELRIVDTTTGNVIDTVELGTTPWSAAVSPDARYVYVGKVDGSGQTLPITRIDIQTGAATPIGGVRQPSAMAISADGATLYVTNYQDGTVSVINTVTGDYYTIDTGLQSDAIALSADGRTLYVGSIINDVRVVNIATKTYTTVATGTYDGMTPADQSITVAGRYVYVTDGLNDKVAVIDTINNNTVIDRVDVGDRPSSVTVSPGGAFVFVANAGGDSVSVIDTETGSVVTTFPVGNNPTHVELSSDGTRLYVTTGDGISIIPTTDIYFIFSGSGDDGPGWSVGVGIGGGGPVLPPVVPGGGLGGGGTGPTLPPIVPGGPGPVNPPGEIYV